MSLPYLAIPLLLLPGAVCLRALCRPRSWVWLLCLPFSVPFVSITAFLLAWAGIFSLGALAVASVVVAGLLHRLLPRDGKSFLAGVEPRFAGALFLLSAILFAYYAPPFEYYFGGRDPGVYVVHGIRIAKTGALLAPDPLVTAVDKNFRTLFFSEKVPLRYMSFQIQDYTGGQIVANFFHLYPVWFAVFYALFGVHGMLYATPFLAACLVLAFGLFVRLVQGEAEALGGGLILGASAIFLWFARFPNSEMISGALIFLSMCCLEGYRRAGRLRDGILGALFLGLSFWARVDAALMGAALVLFLAFLWMEDARPGPLAVLLAVYAVTVGIYLAYALPINPGYMEAVFYNLRFKPVKVFAVLAGAGLAFGAMAWAGRRYRLVQSMRVAALFTGALAVLLAYAYFVRPYVPVENRGSPNAGAFLALGWYFTHPLVALALAGVVLYAYRFRSIHWPFFAATLFYSALYFYRIRGHAEHFWMLRRYLPVICPALAFFAVYAARRILQAVPALRAHASTVILVLCAGLAGWMAYDSRDIHRHGEFRGSFAFLESVANRLQPEDLLIIGARESNDFHIVGPMLSYYFDRNVLQLRTASPDVPLLADFVRSWKGRVYFAGAGNTNLASDRFYLSPQEEIHFETPVYDEVYHARPRLIFNKYFQVGWYTVQFQPPRDPYYVDVGGFDDGSVVNFYIKEEYSGINYRWTNGEGRVFFPPASGPVTDVVLQLNPGPWVPGMERVHVKVYANDMLLVDLILRNGYNTYEVPVPDAIRAKLTGVPIGIRIESKSWIPKRVLNLPDLRRVGVIVDWVRLKVRAGAAASVAGDSTGS